MLLNIIYVFICHLLIFLGDSFLLETLYTFGLDTVKILLLYQFYYCINCITISFYYTVTILFSFCFFPSFLPPFPSFPLFPLNVSIIYSSLLYHQTSSCPTSVGEYINTHTYIYKTHMYYYIYSCIHIHIYNPSPLYPSLCYVVSGYYSKCLPTPVVSSYLVTFTIYFLEESQEVT